MTSKMQKFNIPESRLELKSCHITINLKIKEVTIYLTKIHKKKIRVTNKNGDLDK